MNRLLRDRLLEHADAAELPRFRGRFRLLARVVAEPGVTVNELARRIQLPQSRVSAADESRSAVFDERHQLARSLTRVQRHNDQAFRHRGQIHRDPTDAVGSEQAAPVALLQAFRYQESSRLCDQVKQFLAGHTGHLPIADFLKHTRARGRLQLREDFSDEWHVCFER